MYAIRVRNNDMGMVAQVMVYIGQDGQPTSDCDKVLTFNTREEAEEYNKRLDGTIHEVISYP